MLKKRIYQLLLLVLLSSSIYCQMLDENATDANDQCSYKSIEETILQVEGACRCAYTSNTGSTLIGVGYSLDSETQQQQLQQILSIDADTLNGVVTGDSPLTSTQVLSLLKSSAQLATSNLKELFNDFDDFPAVVKIALIQVYYDIGIDGIKGNTEFVKHVDRQDFIEASNFLEYTDSAQTKKTTYCTEQEQACLLNVKLLDECYQQQFNEGNVENEPKLEDLPVAKQCIIDTCPDLLAFKDSDIFFQNHVQFSQVTTLYDFYSDLLQIYKNHSQPNEVQLNEQDFQTFFNTFWNCLQTCASTKPSSLYEPLNKLTEEENKYFELNNDSTHNKCIGPWDKFFVALYLKSNDFSDYTFREVIKSIRFYLTKNKSSFCSDDVLYPKVLLILDSFDPPISTIPPTPNEDELKNILIDTLIQSECNFIGACTNPKSSSGGFGKTKAQDVIAPEDDSTQSQDQNIVDIPSPLANMNKPNSTQQQDNQEQDQSPQIEESSTSQQQEQSPTQQEQPTSSQTAASTSTTTDSKKKKTKKKKVVTNTSTTSDVSGVESSSSSNLEASASAEATLSNGDQQEGDSSSYSGIISIIGLFLLALIL